MTLLDIIRKESICLLKSHSKKLVLKELIECAAQNGLPCEPDELEERIEYRERLMSTGIGMGIGVPHVRLDGISDPIIIFGLQAEGISGYESIDNLPVKLVFLIIVGKQQQQQQYLKLFAHIVKLLKRSRVIDSLLAAADRESVYQILSEELKRS
jgi:mannitol/fructose-specific phosphotransferase system IIA component (Ntr-type)